MERPPWSRQIGLEIAAAQRLVGVGTTVTVRFPAERVIAEPAMAASARSRAHG